MALQKFKVCSWRRFLLVHLTLHLVLIFGQCAEETDEVYKNGKNLVLEYFLPINFAPVAMEPVKDRGKREVEGSGEGEPILGNFNENIVEDDKTDNSSQNAYASVVAESDNIFSNLTNEEGSGEIEDLSEEKKTNFSSVPIIEDSEEQITTESEEVSESDEHEEAVSTEMIFDRSEDFSEKSIEETSTVHEKIPITSEEKVTTTEATSERTTVTEKNDEIDVATKINDFTETTFEKSTVDNLNIFTTSVPDEETTVVSQTEQPTTNAAVIVEETTAQSVIPETTTVLPTVIPNVAIETTNIPPTVTPEEIPKETTPPPLTTFIPPLNIPAETTISPKIIISEETSSSPVISIETTPTSTQGLPVEQKPLLTTPEPIIEEVFKEVKTIHKDLEASPGNILRKENLTLGADPLLIVNTRIMDSEENVQLSSSEPKRLGAYIVIGLILLSFSSLVGYITFRKRLTRKRQEFESHQGSHDTEKALLSLSDYKDNADLEENHLKNNEITPIVVKSNTQINKFEKNTNFSSPKNLNTIANEKNIEKDNVLKSTAENLTQVIIEDSPKDIEEDKSAPCMEKLIVKTIIDQDSIPKKPIIVNRTSGGYVPIPQDIS